MKRTLLSTMLISIFSLAIIAQNEPKAVRDDNRAIRSITKRVDKTGWLYFKPNQKLTNKELFTDLKDAFGLTVNDEMRVLKDELDSKEKDRHQRLQQYYQGIPVEDAEYFLHYNSKGNIDVASGKLVENLTLSNKPKLTEAEALDKAIKDIGATIYSWQDTSWENSLKREKFDSLATWKPKSDLVITFDEGHSLKKEKAKLAFKFGIIALKPYSSTTIYVDAQNGQIIKKFSNESNCSPRMISATTLYNGQQSFAGCATGWLSRFKTLKREDNNLNIITKRHAVNSAGVPLFFNSLSEVFRPEDNWGATEQQFTSAHWALDKSWTFFRDALNRNGWNGSGGQARLRIDGNISAIEGSNGFAFYDRSLDEMAIGKDIMSLDITAHEFTHGMNDFTARLGETGVFQSRSLNESFADIFGEMVERHATGTTNLSIGNQVPAVFPNGLGGTTQVIRNLVNPAISIPTAQPIIFEGANWVLAGAPHTNGGVQNRWFTLLAQGGTQNGVTVTGIGLNNAQWIAWDNLRFRLGIASNFMDARNGAVEASRAIFGACSNELLQNIRAWQAVGLNAPLPDPIIGSTFNNVYNICMDDQYAFPFTMFACWFPGATFTWNIPSSVTAVANGGQLEVQNVAWAGTHEVTVTATFEGVTRTVIGVIDATYCGNNYLIKPNTETSNTSKGHFSVYPNPTYNFINIDLPVNDVEKVYNLKILNIIGQVMVNKRINYFDNKVEISHLSDGMYNIVLQDIDGNIKHTSKIQKIKQ